MFNKFSLFILLSLTLFQFGAAQEACVTSDTCPSLKMCENNVCVHKPLFPLAGIEIAGIVLIVLLTGLASSGGLSGGVILVPLLLIFFRYAETKCVMIVYAIILGGAIGSYLTTGMKRNPKTKKPFLNYDLTLIIMPPLLLGTSIGIIINIIMAPIIVVVGIVVLIIYSFTKIYIRAVKEYKKETRSKDGSIASIKSDSETTLVSDSNISNSYISPDDEVANKDLQKIIREEHQIIPWKKFFNNVALLALLVLVALLRGTSTFSSIIGAPYCGGGYWLIFVGGLVVCAIFQLFNIRYINAVFKLKNEAGYVDDEEGFVVKEKFILKLSLLGIVAGLLSGMFGVGFAMLMGPSLLKMGLEPQGLSSAAGFFHIPTFFLALFSAILYDEVPLTTYGFFIVIGFIGSFGVSKTLNHLVKKYKRPSLVLFTLLFVLLLAMIATPTYEIIKNIDDLSALLKFKPIC